jgi:hypothetical protein
MVNIVYPSLPRPVDIGTIFDATDQGYKAGKDWRDNKDALTAWDRVAPALFGQQGAPQGTLASLAPVVQQQPDYASQRVASSFGDSPSPLNRYYSALRSAESSGNDAAANQNSSATGRYQFTRGTWDALMTSHPELGLTADGITDPNQQDRAVRALTAANAKSLSTAGIPVNPGNLYAAHFLGAGGAGNVLTKPDNTPMSALVSPEVVQANPQLANMTVGDFKNWTAQKVGGGAPAGAPAGIPAQAGAQVADASGGFVPQGAMPSMPDAASMRALFANPITRPLAIAAAKSRLDAIQDRNDPTKRIQYATALAQLQKLQQPQTTDDIREYEFAKQQGFKGSLGDWITSTRKGVNIGIGTNGAVLDGLPTVPLDDNGTPDKTAQQDFISKLDPSTASLVKGISEYRIPIEKVTSLRGDQRQRLAQIVSQYDPSFDMSQYAARAAMRKSITSGNYSNALNSANLVIQHLDALEKAADGLDNGNYRLLNAGKNLYGSETGNPAITKFNTIADAAGSELAKVFKGTGATSDSEIKEWRKNLDPNASPAQIKASIHTAVADLLKSRLDTIQSQYKAAMGHPSDFSFLTPHSRQVLQDLGIDPSELDPSAQNTSASAAPTPGPSRATGAPQRARNPQTGEIVEWDGTQWRPVQ